MAPVAGVAVIGNLAKDVVAGGLPRPGGAPFHAARGLRLLVGRASLVAGAAMEDRRALLPPLASQGLPVTWVAAERTAAFSFSYDGDGTRTMAVDAVGATWLPEHAALAGRAEWVQVGALAQSDFPAETLAALARGRRIAFDGQGLVRLAQTGPLVLGRPDDLAPLEHVTVLKLAEEEAVALVGEDYVPALRELGVPEVLVTFGPLGSLLLAHGLEERIPARRLPADVDPTGAGDIFLAGYMASRSTGHRPLSAARQATTLVARVLVP
jgi:sugar/nucleoside kinase (ribokinase family)